MNKIDINMKKYLILAGIYLMTVIPIMAQDSEQDPDTVYTRVLIGRVGRFLPDILDQNENPEKYIRVRDIIVQQYKDLSYIHDGRDEKVAALRAMEGLEKVVMNRKIDSVKTEAKVQLYELHAAYLGRLSAELTPEEVDQVKDGMTYGVMPRTYAVYLEMLPDLTDEQKRKIHTWLVEARELAMDKGSSKKKHGTFGKYKGKINNYLSKAGYDLKQAEKDLYERRKNGGKE